jgi:FecR protein
LMGTMRCCKLAVPLVFGVLIATLPAAGFQAGPQPAEPGHTPSDTTYPQIVRISYLEGDVRIARGKDNEKATGNTWKTATADLPLETGFNLATLDGRAEIEFEDGSTVYLGENSVLSFTDLHTTGDVPHTEMTLLAGTLSLHIETSIPGESFLLNTPTDSINNVYPKKSYLRIDSYLDAIAITPQKPETFRVSGAVVKLAARGKTLFYDDGQPVEPQNAIDPTVSAAWDTWVAKRVAVRSAAIAAVAKESGLPASLPGLADMNGQGTFFKCEPYGTCWQPAEDSGALPQTVAATDPTAPDFAVSLSKTAATINPGGHVSTNVSVSAVNGFSGAVAISSALPNGFTCKKFCDGPINPGQPQSMQFNADADVPPGTYTVAVTADSGALAHEADLTIDVVAGEETGDVVLPLIEAPVFFPCGPDRIHYFPHRRFGSYRWTVCHAGSWIFREKKYVWVVDRRMHHHPPIRWVKCDGKICYVPRHPRDKPGEPPINCKHKVYEIADKKGDRVKEVTLDPHKKIEEAKEPKEFRNSPQPELSHADEPKIVAHNLKNEAAASTESTANSGGVPLTFDPNKQSFMLSTVMMKGDKRTVVAAPFTGRNNAPHMGGGNARGPATHSGSTHAGGGARTGGGSHTGGGGGHTGGGSHPSGGGGHTGGGGHSGGGGHAGGGGGHSSHH